MLKCYIKMLFKNLAKNEMAHAKKFWDLISKHGEKINKNIQKHNKQMVRYYATKYDFVNIIEILDRYGKKRIKGEKTDV